MQEVLHKGFRNIYCNNLHYESIKKEEIISKPELKATACLVFYQSKQKTPKQLYSHDMTGKHNRDSLISSPLL